MDHTQAYVGLTEESALRAIDFLSPDAYGIPIQDLVSQYLDRQVTVGEIYSTLARLERKKYIASTPGKPQPIRGGKAKKYFQITPSGLNALSQIDDMRKRMARGPATLGDLGHQPA